MKPMMVEFQDEDIPAAIQRLVDPTRSEGQRLRTFDSSRFEFRNNQDNDDNDDDYIENTNRLGELHLLLVRLGTSVKAIEFHRFRAMLIDKNFNIAFHENQLKWPKRFAKDLKPVPILTSSSTSTNLHL
jgi:hypothetical protein